MTSWLRTQKYQFDFTNLYKVLHHILNLVFFFTVHLWILAISICYTSYTCIIYIYIYIYIYIIHLYNFIHVDMCICALLCICIYKFVCSQRLQVLNIYNVNSLMSFKIFHIWLKFAIYGTFSMTPQLFSNF